MVTLIKAGRDQNGNRTLTFMKRGIKRTVQTIYQLPITHSLLIGCRGLGDLSSSDYERCVEEVENTAILTNYRIKTRSKVYKGRGEKVTFRQLYGL